MHVDPDVSVLPLEAELDTPGWQFAVAGGILGWVLDAFDFFVVVFLFNELMAKFHVGKPAIVWSLTLTLAMRPVGALLFGFLADRYGRRKPLILCVLYFSTITVLSGFAPNYVVFLALRGLYGIGMGGYWGIGASYSMESAPRRMRGFLSGMMQGGYPFGYLMASIGIQTVAPRFGWQAMFVVGSIVALGIVLITWQAPESDAWKLHRSPSFRSMVTTLLSLPRLPQDHSLDRQSNSLRHESHLRNPCALQHLRNYWSIDGRRSCHAALNSRNCARLLSIYFRDLTADSLH
jgi:MFS transporter, SHS family, lactate transporter